MSLGGAVPFFFKPLNASFDLLIETTVLQLFKHWRLRLNVLTCKMYSSVVTQLTYRTCIDYTGL